ncbi:MAG: pro-sigmaK processing inhibitor BofA family protein [Anaerovoracaceae bacterium]
MSVEIGILLAYGFGILVLYILGYLFLVPLRFLLKLIGNSIAGGLFILVVNWIGGNWDIHIPLNLLSALFVGVLGLPGAILLLILNNFI